MYGKHNHVPIYGWIRPVELYGEEVDGFDAILWQPLPAKPDASIGVAPSTTLPDTKEE